VRGLRGIIGKTYTSENSREGDASVGDSIKPRVKKPIKERREAIVVCSAASRGKGLEITNKT